MSFSLGNLFWDSFTNHNTGNYLRHGINNTTSQRPGKREHDYRRRFADVSFPGFSWGRGTSVHRPIECKMYLEIQQKRRLVAFQNRPCSPPWRKQPGLSSSKDDFLMKIFPSATKRKLSILLNFLFRFLVFLRCFFNPEIQNSCLKTSAWWLRGSHLVENGYPSLRSPNMVKVNVDEHWARGTRFNTLWVSAWTVSRSCKEVQADIKTIL